MTTHHVFAVLGAVLLALGFGAFIARAHLLWKIIALNIAATGVFLLLVTLPARVADAPDALPQAMVLTGIVVAVATTAFALALALRVAGLPRRPGGDPSARE